MYVTLTARPKARQLTLEDLLNGPVDIRKFNERNYWDEGSTYTTVRESVISHFSQDIFTDNLIKFKEMNNGLYNADRGSLYTEFRIPKRSGGLRKIDAPNDALKAALTTLKDMLENVGASHHTAAYAYVKHRCAVNAVKKHQAHDSKYFLKTDFSDFFGSTTRAFVMQQMKMIHPFATLNEEQFAVLEEVMDLCFLNGGLPQGTPISPMLTNLIMIPVDHEINKMVQEQGKVYTRYADDILISSKFEFNFKDTVEQIKEVLKKFEAPYNIKPEKTRYGSRAGSNWNLGVMLNKDNNITIGYQRKKEFKAMCCSYVLDRKNGKPWNKDDILHFQGIMSYYLSIEEEAIRAIIEATNTKFGASILEWIKEDLKPNIE